MHYKIRVSLLCVATFGASAAGAECPNGQYDFTSCKIEGRNTEVSVCYDSTTATYSYGPVGGTPDLVLSEPIGTVDFQPWHGVGKAIFDSMTFYNEDYSYQVGGGFDRPFSEEEMEQGIRRFGWIDIAKNGQSIATLECEPDTVSYGFGDGIFDVKLAAGYEWDSLSRTWVSTDLTPPETPLLVGIAETNGAVDCLVASEFALGGVTLDDTDVSLAKLGSPEMTTKLSPQGLPIDQISAHGLNISMTDGTILEMTASSDGWPTPSGIRVGMTRGEVIRLLGRAPAGIYPAYDEFKFPICTERTEGPAFWSAVISFGHDRRVNHITFLGEFP